MMRRIILTCCLNALLLIMTVPLQAQSGLALTMRAGTLGAELGLAKSIGSLLSVRGGVNFFKFGISGRTESDDPVDYNLDLNLFSVSALVDFHPFAAWFRLTGGAVFNNNSIEGTGKAVKNYQVDDEVYTPDDIGELTAKIAPSMSVTPYIGLGFGNPVAKDQRLGFFIDFGVLYQGSPDVTLEADENDMIFPTTTQEADVEEDIKNLKWYPVFALGLSFQF